MNLQFLYQTGAFAAGSDCWVIPALEESHWSQQIDWYLNLQLSRARLHTPQELGAELSAILTEEDLEFPFNSDETHQALMVSSSLNLPTQKVVELPPGLSSKEWIMQAHKLWKTLQQPRLRLFLPPQVQESDLQRYWSDPESTMSVVTDYGRQKSH